MKILSVLLVLLTIYFPSSHNKGSINADKTIMSDGFKLKKTRWLEPAKVFIYEVDYAKKSYIIKYSYAEKAGIEILDAQQMSQIDIQLGKDETVLILKAKTIKKSTASKKLDIGKDIAPELMDLINLDLINMPGIGVDDQLKEAGYQTNVLGTVIGLIKGALDRFSSDCYSTASCTCHNIGTSSVRCRCGQNATCGTVEVQRCTQGPSGPENCRTETRCMAACR